jgi:hypothetical protein
MRPEQYAALPDTLVVRELRYHIRLAGRRTRRVSLVTTLLDPKRYPAAALAYLYGLRWRAETDLKHLKETLGLDVLRTQTVFGVLKELLARDHLQLGATGDACGCAATGNRAVAGELRGCLAVAAARAAGATGAGAAGQPGAVRACRATGAQAPAQTV